MHVAGRLLESWHARGHPNVTGTHRTTLEFTHHTDLGPQGDCILGVGVSLSPAGFSKETKAAIRAGRHFRLEIEAAGFMDVLHGTGHHDLSLDDNEEMVFRKSPFTSGRTVLVHCDKAVMDLDRALVASLSDPGTVVRAKLYVLASRTSSMQ